MQITPIIVPIARSPTLPTPPGTPVPVCHQAAVVLFNLVRNSTFAVAAAWLFTFIFSLGNIFSGLPPTDQSLASFTAASTAWTNVLSILACVALPSAGFLPLRFLSQPNTQPTLLRCARLLLRRTYKSGIVFFVLSVAVAYLVGLGSPRVQQWKLHFYLGGAVINMYTMQVTEEARRIYQLETVEGQARGVVDQGSAWQRFVRVYKKNLPMLASIHGAAVYVQISSQVQFTTTLEVLFFAMGSLLLKLCIQEVAGHVVMRQAQNQQHRMYLAVTLPTVLIDTQVRILLLRANVSKSSSRSHQFELIGSIVLAIVEVVVRVAKIWWLRRKITRRALQKDASRRKTMTLTTTTNTSGPCVATPPDQSSVETMTTDFEQWKQRRLRFHAAETQADMYAEYIAIGCSMAIYYFYHAHPKYRLTDNNTAVSARGSVSSTQIVVFQVFLELVIDFVCCMIEIRTGVPCKVPRSSSVFVAALVTTSALINVVLSSAMYLTNDSGQ